MRKFTCLPPVFLTLLFSCLPLVLGACSVGGSSKGTASVISGGDQITATAMATKQAIQTMPMPETDISCPAVNSGRAAVTRPLKLSKRQNLVYIYNEVPVNTSTSYGHLRRYDMASRQVINIVDSGLHISQAQVSVDGQWILFLSVPDPRGDMLHSAMLQLVRVDGQGLQTLYCFPAVNGTVTSSVQFQWSVDEKSIAISVQTQNIPAALTTSLVFTLNFVSGAVRQIFFDSYNATYNYQVMTWLDDTRFYLLMQGSQLGNRFPLTLYLVNARTATAEKPGLKTVLTLPAHLTFFSIDSSYNGKKLFTSICTTQGSGMVTVQPSTGGKGQAIESSTGNMCAVTIRAISANSLLLLVDVAGQASYQVWTMHLDGTNKRIIATFSNSQSYALNISSQFPWSNVSRNGTSYALQQGLAANRQGILIGSLKGGDPHVVVTSDNLSSGLDLVGWIVL